MLEQGDVVLCTVERIIGTIVFVKVHAPEGELEGTIITSEIAPGRIRNLREYVVPKKKIVCKILKFSGGQIHLSLRRVTQKEKKEVLEQEKQEKSYESVLRSILGEKSEEVIKKIKLESSLYDFIESSKLNPAQLEKILGKEEAKKVIDIISNQKEKKVVIKKTIKITTTEPDGLEKIKTILSEVKKKQIEIKYLSGGKYSLKKEANNFKEANSDVKSYLEDLEKKSKENNLSFTITEK